MHGKIDLAENSNARKIKLAENRTRGKSNWQDFEHVEKLDLILTYSFRSLVKLFLDTWTRGQNNFQF